MGIYIRREVRDSHFSSLPSYSLSNFSLNLQSWFFISSRFLQIFKFFFEFFPDLFFDTMSEEHQEVAVEEGPVPVLKWDLGLFEQIVRSFRFPPEWDARYPAQGQTSADAPPGYITLYEDFFLQGNFRLPATNFLGNILHYYNFHLSQMSPPGMVRVRHFEFLCRSHGIEPSVEKFRAFYQLQRTMGFFSFASRGAAKKILLNPPKSFHDWKPKFFFIREEVLPIAMPFRDWTEAIPKEDLPIPKNARWYQQLTPTPNRVFGENVLVAAKMSDQWLPSSREVPVLKIGDQEAQLYQAAFTFGGSMGVRPLRDDEESWYDQIKGNFMFPVEGAFASPPTATEGVLRDLGIDPEERKKKPSKKKKTKVDAEVTSKDTGPSRATAAADKGGSKSSGSAGSRNPDAGATPEDDEAEEEDAAARLIGRKRGRSETTAGVASAPTAVVLPVVGKTSNLRSLYKFSPEIKKKTPEKGVTFSEAASKRPKITINLLMLLLRTPRRLLRLSERRRRIRRERKKRRRRLRRRRGGRMK
ncbi:hypothetical protein HanOQP8_Chr15g0560631 [Helianthus annuus]|nr:hypothetical protein HanOQP8_Chr15g0560631 [Helianthus annuus]